MTSAPYVMPSDGVVTGLSLQGDATGTGAAIAEVFRSTGGNAYAVIGQSPTATFTSPNQTIQFTDLHIPVDAGDFLGLWVSAGYSCGAASRATDTGFYRYSPGGPGSPGVAVIAGGNFFGSRYSVAGTFEPAATPTPSSTAQPSATATPSATPPPAPTASPSPTSTPEPHPRPRSIPHVLVTVAFIYHRQHSRTRLSRLVVQNVPRNATIRARCGSGCSRESLTIRGRHGTVSLKAMIKRPLKAGIVIVITVIKPGQVGAVKIVTTHAHRAPSIATRCIMPSHNKPAACV